MYAQYNNPLPVWIIYHQLTNPYLHQFSSISGGNCIKDNEEDDSKPGAKRIKQEPEDEPQSWTQEEQTEEPPPKPWADKKDYQAIFRKCISVGEDGGEDYDVIDIQIEAQKAVRRITDHLEIVKQYLKW